MQKNSLDKAKLKSKLWNRNFVFVLLYAVLCNLTMSVSNTVLPLYVVNGLGLSAAQSGLLGTVFTVGSCVCRFVAGGICDRAGYRKIMALGALLVGGALFFQGFSSTFVLILGLKFIQGVGHSLNSTASNTAVADIIPEDRFADGMGYYGLHSTLTNAVGPGLSLALMAVVVAGSSGGQNYRLPLVTAGIFGFAAMVLGIFVTGKNSAGRGKSPSREKRRIRVKDFIEIKALPVALLQAVQAFTVGAGVYMILYANARGYHSVSFYYTLSAAVSLATRFIIGDRMDRVKPAFFAVFASTLSTAAYLLLGILDSEPVFIVSGVLTGISNAILMPLYNSLVLKMAHKSRSGAASATYWLGFDIGIAIGQVIFGAVIDMNGGGSYCLAFVIAGSLLAAYALASFLYLRKKPPLREMEMLD